MMLSIEAARMGSVHTSLRKIGTTTKTLISGVTGVAPSSRNNGRHLVVGKNGGRAANSTLVLPPTTIKKLALKSMKNGSVVKDHHHHHQMHYPSSLLSVYASSDMKKRNKSTAPADEMEEDSIDDVMYQNPKQRVGVPPFSPSAGMGHGVSNMGAEATAATAPASSIHAVQHGAPPAPGTHHYEPWMMNLGRDNEYNEYLMKQRDDAWFTGLSPNQNCPGVDVETKIIRSLPLPNLSAVTRQAALDYFNNSWSLYETLFAGLKGEEGFYRPPVHGLRHPQIFYYGHTACLYINKLRVSGVLSKPVNAYYESIFEVGVDEMLWDDMNKNDMIWPTVSEVHQYRMQVYQTVVDAIMTHPSLDTYGYGSGGVAVDQSHPMWALFMGFEHERIHLETSSVLFRETPYHLVQTPQNWPPLHPSAYDDDSSNNNKKPVSSLPASNPRQNVDYPTNGMVAVGDAHRDGMIVDLGKPANFPSFGWDNEYGERNMSVPPFEASKYMISNGEYYQFVVDGGYRNKEYWCDDGWSWRTHRNMKWPFFWEQVGPAGSHEYSLRTIFEIIPMKWNWPVDVNYYEAKAYCRWKTKQDNNVAAIDLVTTNREYRLLTEAEHHIIRHREHNLNAARDRVEADKVMVTSGQNFPTGSTGTNLNLAYSSQNPVDYFPPSQTGHYDTTGSAWEWTEDHFNPLKGFEVHHVYEDFSTPCFDGKHSMIVGGSFISTGDEASVFARFHFRPHFLQHSGFRIVSSDHDAPATHLYAGNAFAGQAAAAAEYATTTQPVTNTHSTATTGNTCNTTPYSTHSNDGNNNNGANIPNNNVYETNDSLHMYIGLHYPSSGNDDAIPPILPHNNVPNHAIRFPQRVANLLLTLQPEKTNDRALDIGCAVGGSSFELAKSFDSVDAFDFSKSFIDTAKLMQEGEEVRFRIPVEAELYEEVRAVHEDGVTPEVRSKVNFFTGDACNINGMVQDGQLNKYDGIVMSNLLCRLPDPMACIDGLPTIINKGGVIVMVTPYSWLTEFTSRGRWLGGFYDPVTKEPIHSKDVLRELMEQRGFVKIHEEQMPLMIREHQRKYQYIVSEATGWRRIG